jgi:hypothetical protein
MILPVSLPYSFRNGLSQVVRLYPQPRPFGRFFLLFLYAWPPTTLGAAGTISRRASFCASSEAWPARPGRQRLGRNLRSRFLPPRSWPARAMVTSSCGPAISSSAARISSTDPNGSRVPWMNNAGVESRNAAARDLYRSPQPGPVLCGRSRKRRPVRPCLAGTADPSAARLFSERDGRNGHNVIIVSQPVARKFWPDEEPVGKRIDMGLGDMKGWQEVVGVVPDVKREGLDQAAGMELYVPYSQVPVTAMTLVIRSTMDVGALAAAARAQVLAIDKDQRSVAGLHRHLRRSLELGSAANARDRHSERSWRERAGYRRAGTRPRHADSVHRNGGWPHRVAGAHPLPFQPVIRSEATRRMDHDQSSRPASDESRSYYRAPLRIARRRFVV